MRLTDLKGTSWGRIAGIVVMVIGALILFAPIFFGGWIIGLIGIALVAAGFFQIIQLIRSDAPVESFFEYVPGALTLILGIVLFLSPNLLVSGLLLGVTLYLVTDGGFKVYNAFKHTGHERRWNLFNGIFGIILGIVFWRLLTANLGIVAIGVAVGLKLVVDGWQMVFHTELTVKGTELKYDPREHPDRLLGLEPNDAISEMQTKLVRSEKAQVAQNVYWCLTMLVIFFAIHVLRTDAKWSYIGLISPFSAVVGDMVVALILGIVLILPIRLFLRKVSRPVERAAWRRFLHLDQAGAEPAIPEKLLAHWIEWRMRFSLEMKKIRSSINFAFWWLLRAGLPLTAVLIAVNSIWGFSWYFNSENWASGVWQRITSVRVDKWRASMTEDVEQNALAGGVAPDKVFAIEPEGITGTDDFSFVVIGDTGEGDPSQMVLRDQLIAAGKRDQVKFLLLSSDVIYPDGKMKDYERNFYLPFKGFDKPIYAIPGNHDWFDANEGFNANFLDADSAKLALRARLIRDVKTDLITTDQRFSEIVAEAARLRQYYGIKNGLQRGPYFDFHTPGFSLIAVDTGILRTLDERQKAWFEAALARSGNNFKMVILGHPFYVAGSEADTGDAEFSWIHETLRKYGVEVAMAGDTHDFEFYRERYSHEGKDREMLNFVNGGGGAYLSIGTAIAFPEKPATQDYAFYPRTDELMAKIDRETPVWKAPFLIWLRRFGGFPFDSEMVSGAFDFNYAPFFQSFVEVNVERSKGRVRLQLYGANGPLRWRDIQIGGSVKPQDRSDDDPVEFIAPLRPAQ